jgi:UDP-N-acetylmuramoyl-tripeptide--D-alanyl-D-alanine ligase
VNMTLREIAHALGVSCDADAVVTRIGIDSRTVASGDLFFCIVGQNMDGHRFAAQAVAAGARAVVASVPLELPVPVLMVRDTTEALGRLARAWRERSSARVVGVTGSAGKTTVKEMLAQVLSAAGTTTRNFRNLNNQIGLPLSILEMTGTEDFWVLELGISRPGDMDELGRILAPDAALIVNIGPCHLEGLGDLAGVAREKSILLDHVRAGGFCCVNADYPLLVQESAARPPRRVLFSGSGLDAVYSCQQRTVRGDRAEYILNVHGTAVPFEVSANVHVDENMTAVAAMGLELGLTSTVIASALSAYAPVTQRFAIRQARSWTLIDDTYNANPVSMARSIREAERMAQGRRLVLVLADMRELGVESANAHRELGRIVAGTSCTHIFFYGEHAEDVRAGLAGFSGVFEPVREPAEVALALRDVRDDGGVMLFKGSRGCKMEHFYSFVERNWA